jgi:hypothetical protein
MAVVSTASKLLLGRVQGLSRVASTFKYATTCTGKYANSNSEVKGRGKVALIHTVKTGRGVEVSLHSFLGSFAKLRKLTISVFMYMYVLIESLGSD